MKTMHLALSIALASTLSTSPSARAESESLLPQEHHKGDVVWISGGIGKDEADAMRQVASRYNLRLVIAEAQEGRAAFLSQASVKISDAKGKVVLDVRTDGPLLFLKLAPGRYAVSAEVAGHAIAKLVRVKDKGSVEITLTWPQSVA